MVRLEDIKAVTKKKRDKMAVADRAKQFMPFAAVKGLDEALERKRRERMLVEKAVLSPDMEEALNEKISSLQKGMAVSVSYYCAGEYLSLHGRIEKVDSVGKQITVSGEEIAFEDIWDIG